MSDGFLESFVTAGEDGAALVSSTTATSLIPGARKITLPSYFFDRVGKSLRIRASGRISTVTAAPGTLTLDVRLGSVVVFNGGAMSLNTTAQVNVNWVFDVLLICRSIGAVTAATLFGQGTWQSHAVIGSAAPAAGGAGTHMLPYNAAPVVGTGFDSTAAQPLDLFGTWSVSSASNSILIHQYSVKSPT